MIPDPPDEMPRAKPPLLTEKTPTGSHLIEDLYAESRGIEALAAFNARPKAILLERIPLQALQTFDG